MNRFACPIASDEIRLHRVKVLHTAIWAFFAGCIVAIPILGWIGRYHWAALVSSVVALEVLVLGFNGWRCPLTPIAARYTEDRGDNFDIYLPRWLARHNKAVFGAIYVAGMLLTAALWVASA